MATGHHVVELFLDLLFTNRVTILFYQSSLKELDVILSMQLMFYFFVMRIISLKG